jgi:hypothetical protein
MAFRRPIRISELGSHLDNHITVSPDQIVIGLKRDTPEAGVAHELLHAILQAEGFPLVFHLEAIETSATVADMMRSDFDHLVINRRMRALGYDSEAFLADADSHRPILEATLRGLPYPDTVVLWAVLHSIAKYRYYLGRPDAAKEILSGLPTIRPYWERLDSAIMTIPDEAMPRDIWTFIRIYVDVFARIALDLGAPLRLSALIGFVPILLTQADVARRARDLFTQTIERAQDGSALVRIYRNGLMASAFIASTQDHINACTSDLALPAGDYIRRRRIQVRQV